ncbi:MAG: S-layer homology domain-containing protein [Oscillospiraceae bacterium]|nr:S-layer homology domain-containing protein [Oscillospiraceae bacterium]
MKVKSRILALCLSLLLLAGLLPGAALAAGNVAFDDVPVTSWYYNDVKYVSEQGLMTGTAADAFSPELAVTRGMLVTILYRMEGEPETGSAAFVDVEDGAYYAAAVAWAAENGIVTGYSDTAFGPADNVTREQFATILYRYAIYKGMDEVTLEENLGGFTDAADISDWAISALNWAVGQELIGGMGDGTVAPSGTATRAQAAAILCRYLGGDTDAGLQVGAGAGEIVFTEAVFASNIEGFSGEIHDNPYARVLLIEDGDAVAIVSLELVNVSSDMVTVIQELVSEKTGIAAENVWVHCTHAITTPHAPSDETELAAYTDAILLAMNEAVEEAAASFQSATMSVGTGTCDVNANRDIEINGAWYYGLGSELESNKEMTIVRFDGADGAPIGMYISYGIKPTAIDNAGKSENLRQISSDVPGLACVLMEEEYDCPVMFCMPAAGDQIPKETAMYYVDDGAGGATEVSLTVEEGIEIVQRLGTEMGETAIKIAGDTTAVTDTAVSAVQTAYTYANKAEDGMVEISVSAITIGDTLALVGFKPEMNAVTELQLQAASPYETTLLVSFLNGDQKYMPDELAYERETWEYTRSGFAKGCAEEFVEVATALLEAVKDGTWTGGESGGSSGGAYLGGTVELGGYTWTILTQSGENYLVLCDSVVETRAYQADGSAVTWETSDIRAYLNGEFYETTFSEAEQALIVETEIQNASNLHYGINGGNSTTDSVFLLSLDEAENYLSGTDLIIATDDAGTAVWWYLRSPGEATDVAAGVSSAGVIDYHGTATGVAGEDAIRPAMWVSAAALD